MLRFIGLGNLYFEVVFPSGYNSEKTCTPTFEIQHCEMAATVQLSIICILHEIL